MIVEQEVTTMKEEKSAAVTPSMLTPLKVGLLDCVCCITEVKAEVQPKPKEQVKSTPWNQEQLQLLVKGVNLYPPGTADRFVSPYHLCCHPCKGGTPLLTTSIHMCSWTKRQQPW